MERVAIDGQKLVIVGWFEQVGRPCGAWVSFDLTTGAPDEAGPVVAGDVWEAISDGEGGYFLAGAIRGVNGISRQGLAHLLVDGSLSPWAPNLVGNATALALRGDTLFVGGSFTSISGIPRQNLAALDATTGAVLPWDVPVNGLVRALDLVEDTLYIGGDFRAIAGLSRPGLGAIDARIAAPTAWTLPLIGSPYAIGTPLVTRIVHDGSRLFVGGDFNFVGATPAGGLAVVDLPSGVLLPSAHPEAGGWIERIVFHGGRVYVSGGMSMQTPVGSVHGLVALHRSTLQAVPWDPVFPRTLRIGAAVAVFEDRVFVSEGWMDQSRPPEPVCLVDTLSGSAVAFPAPLRAAGGSQVFAIAGDRLFAGGPFQLLTTTPRRYIAEIDLSTGQLTNRTFDLIPGEVPLRVAADAGRVFLWTNRSEMLAFDGASAPNWRRSFNNAKRLLAANGHLIVAGRESPADAAERTFDLDPATGATRPWAPTFVNPAGAISVDALAFDGERLYVGGFFQSVNGQSTGGVVAFRWADLGLESVSFDSILGVRHLAVAPGRLIAIGDVVGRPSPTLASLDRSSGSLLPWAPLGSAFLDPARHVGLAVLDDDAFVGHASPYEPYGTPVFYRASLSTPSWASGLMAGAARVTDVVSGSGRLALVGEFRGMGTVATSNVAVLSSPTVDVPWSVEARMGGLQVRPDPARDRVEIRWSRDSAPVRLDILDVTGRRVRAIALSQEQGNSLVWDLRGLDGSQVSAGVHFAVVTSSDGSRATSRFVVLR